MDTAGFFAEFNKLNGLVETGVFGLILLMAFGVLVPGVPRVLIVRAPSGVLGLNGSRVFIIIRKQ